MFVIQFDNTELMGGFGDRILGLISVKMMSKKLKKSFYISWNKEDIRKYLNYEKYDYELLDIKEDVTIYNSMNNQTKFKRYLMTSKNLFLNKINIFKLNQEISQYLYKNPLFKTENYIKNIFNEYKSLYTDILIPTPFLSNKISQLTNNKSNLIGIQLRCGADAKMSNNKTQAEINRHNGCYGPPWKHIPQTQRLDDIFITLLSNIKLFCDKKYKEYNIFITSDYAYDNRNDIYIIASKIWHSEFIIYNDDPIQHLDRKIHGDNSKVFIDNYILSQKTKMLFISTCSNYARIAALSSNHDEIYDFNCNILNKKNLLSKHEMLF